MTSLSTILAEIEASAEKIKTLEADLATTKENSKSLVEQYRTQSADALKTLGIAEAPRKERKARSHEAVLIGAAARSIRQSVTPRRFLPPPFPPPRRPPRRSSILPRFLRMSNRRSKSA
jgi:hypothetical protein